MTDDPILDPPELMPGEKIADPNVAAYLAKHGLSVRVVRRRSLPAPWWERLFTWPSGAPDEPRTSGHGPGPDECYRDGRILWVGERFHARMEAFRERAAG